MHFHAVAGIRAHLLASDVELHSAINCGRARLLFCLIVRFGRWGSGRQLGSILEPRGLQVFQQAFSAAFASETTLAVTTESARSVEQIRAIHPDHTRFKLSGNVQRDVDALAPNA